MKVTDNAEHQKIGDHDILIKVKLDGINPIDHFVVSGALPKIDPLPHIPGAESSGIIEQVGSHINNENFMAASLPVACLTPYHALNESGETGCEPQVLQ